MKSRYVKKTWGENTFLKPLETCALLLICRSSPALFTSNGAQISGAHENVPEQVKFKSARIWRRPLLAPSLRQQWPRKHLSVVHPEFGQGVIVFEKQQGVWLSVHSSPNLGTFRNQLADDVRIMLSADNATWDWTPHD